MAEEYSSVQELIAAMKIGDTEAIPIPEKLPNFRKYLSEISAVQKKKFLTRVKDGKLLIMRVEYYSFT